MRRRISRATSAPTYKRANISPVTVLAAGSNCVWYSINIVPLSVGKTALVYDVYCKPGGTEGEGEVVALKERLRNAVQEFETRWKSGGELGYVVGFSFFFPITFTPTPFPGMGYLFLPTRIFGILFFFFFFSLFLFPQGCIAAQSMRLERAIARSERRTRL